MDQTERVELLLTLIESDGVLDVQATSGETPLLLACRSMTAERREDIVCRLLKHGANPNVPVSFLQHVLFLDKSVPQRKIVRICLDLT